MTTEFTIGDYDPETRSVPVIFTQGEIVFQRPVNAVLTADGDYDPDATAIRVGEVARGVEQKIRIGAIRATPAPLDTAPAEPPPAPRSGKAGKARAA